MTAVGFVLLGAMRAPAMPAEAVPRLLGAGRRAGR